MHSSVLDAGERRCACSAADRREGCAEPSCPTEKGGNANDMSPVPSAQIVNLLGSDGRLQTHHFLTFLEVGAPNS
jgi:hypothetical protein